MARQPGVANRNKHAMANCLKQRWGEDFNLIMLMAENAMAIHEMAKVSNTVQHRVEAINALDKVAQYIYPKLKAIEVDLSNDDGSLKPVTQVRLIAVRERPVQPEGLQAAIIEHIEHQEHLGSMD